MSEPASRTSSARRKDANASWSKSGGLSTLVVLGMLAGVAVWGHHTGWKAQKFAELFGGAKGEEKEDWCETHNVPDSQCIACHPELVGHDAKDWCKEHGVPESQCTTCHPELLVKGKIDDWCKEHGVPESQCTECHPEIAVKGDAPPSDATVTAAGDDKPAPDPLLCKTHLVKIQFASGEAVKKAGVGLEAVQERPMAATVAAAGEIDYDQTRVARVAARAAGTVRRVDAENGRKVKAGDVLALVDAGDVGRAKSEFLQALATVEQKTALVASLAELRKEADGVAALASESLERTRATSKEGFRTQGDVKEAESKLAEARMAAAEKRAGLVEAQAAVQEGEIRLLAARQALSNLGVSAQPSEFAPLSQEQRAEKIRLLGIPESVAATLDRETSGGNLVALVAPFDGVVVSRDVGLGETVDSSRPLFVVADLAKMWVNLDVREEDAARVALGQNVVFRPDGADAAVTGKVAWIATEVGEKTRTLRVRAEVGNADGRLRARTFGSGRVVVRESPKATAVPTEAIHWDGCCNVVFVRLTDAVFQTRKVHLGAHDARYTEVLAGVLPGEVVASSGSHVLKAELLKSKLGAGCCD
jgi:cobalt-zinc-cadmium efflux system membrane fusion protein